MSLFDGLEALAALSETGTMTAAATQLRLTQSAISKRIAGLADEVGFEIVERDGRRVRLTPGGAQLLEDAQPHVAALRAAVGAESAAARGSLSLGVSDSILASWGPAALRAAAGDVDLTLHAHRSPVAVDRVRSGELHAALVAGESDLAPDLVTLALGDEPMVLVASGERARGLHGAERIEVLSIERGAATWRSLRRRLGHLKRAGSLELVVTRTVQAYAPLVQMARAGFGHGLAPHGIVAALGVPRSGVVRLPQPGLTRPISLVTRRSLAAREPFATFAHTLRLSIPSPVNF